MASPRYHAASTPSTWPHESLRVSRGSRDGVRATQDMESIDSLAKMINNFKGGLVLVSHDMRLISQVAKEIWICDKKKVERYQGDILKFKLAAKKAQRKKLDQHANG